MTVRHRLPFIVLVGQLLIGGCGYTNPMLHPSVWDPYGNQGELLVRGQDPAAAGPQIFAALAARPELKEPLGRQGEPDALEVIGRSMAPKSIVLKYLRADAGAPRDVTLQQTRNGAFTFTVVPRPTPTATPKTTRSKRPAATPAAAAPPSAERVAPKTCAATADQAVRCPIDPSRPDCRALCEAGAPCEWCK